MQMNTFRTLLVDELREAYYAETLVEEAYRRLVRGAASEELRSFFQAQKDTSAKHQKQLDKAFEQLHENPRGGRALSMKALLQEIEDRMSQSGERHVLDAGLLLGAQRIGAWKAATYKGLGDWAALQLQTSIATLLREVLEDQAAAEKDVDALAENLGIQAKVTA